jgi:hypothetical protein
MASAKFPRLEAVLEEMGDFVVKQAKRNLTEKRERINVRAKWKDGRPTSFEFKKGKRKSSASGTLEKSLGYDLKETNQGIVIEYRGRSYGLYLDKGRYPFMKSVAQGKGIPPSAMNRWIEEKKVKPRDLTTGQFIKIDKNKTQIKTMAFLMNRKIKWFGIEPTHFFSEPEEQARDKFEQKIIEAFEEDIANQVTA